MRLRARSVSLSVKLGAILLAVVVVALGVVYVAVVPRLEARLVDAKLEELSHAAPALATQLELNPVRLQDQVELASEQIDARVVVLERLAGGVLVVAADSSPVSGDVGSDAIARQARGPGQLVAGRVERANQELAEAAVALRADPQYTLLLSARLDDAVRNVALVRRSLLIAGAVAIAISWLAGSLAALRLTGRIGRLEAAAERIADGDFAVEVRDEGRDELGELAVAFDRMRVRLARLDDARREFIANASHELRTPLFAVGGFLELLADEELDESTRRDFVEAARAQVERLTRLATDLLDLSRLDAGQVDVAAEPVELAGVAGALVEEFRGLAEASGHELVCALSGGSAAIGDAERVLQIGRSLVENALRHTPARTVIEVGAAGDGAGRATLFVRDNGPGLREGDRERVFERFYRGEGSAAFGTGIGLAIARELARRMGGTIEVASRPGETTFTLVLPGGPSRPAFSRENALA